MKARHNYLECLKIFIEFLEGDTDVYNIVSEEWYGVRHNGYLFKAYAKDGKYEYGVNYETGELVPMG